MQSESIDQVLERLQLAYRVGSLPGLARAMDRPVTTIRSWKSRGQVPLEYLVQAVQQTGVTLDSLVLGPVDDAERVLREHNAGDAQVPWGVAEERRSLVGAPAAEGSHLFGHGVTLLHKQGQNEEARPYVLAVEWKPGIRTEFEVIPKHTGSASAGPGFAGQADDVIEMMGEMAFTPDWLDRQLGADRGHLVSIRVSGDSMAPTILDGETIVIDRDVHDVSVSGIYVIAPRGNRQVKRIQLRLDGSLEVISDNQAYKTEVVHADHVDKLTVVGRMVWPRVR